jgi:hypothetical protein
MSELTIDDFEISLEKPGNLPKTIFRNIFNPSYSQYLMLWCFTKKVKLNPEFKYKSRYVLYYHDCKAVGKQIILDINELLDLDIKIPETTDPIYVCKEYIPQQLKSMYLFSSDEKFKEKIENFLLDFSKNSNNYFIKNPKYLKIFYISSFCTFLDISPKLAEQLYEKTKDYVEKNKTNNQRFNICIRE